MSCLYILIANYLYIWFETRPVRRVNNKFIQKPVKSRFYRLLFYPISKEWQKIQIIDLLLAASRQLTASKLNLEPSWCISINCGDNTFKQYLV